MSKIFWDRRLQHLQFTDVEVGRRTAQVQSLNVSQKFFWDLRSSLAKKLWNMTNSASSTFRSLFSPLALSQIFFCTTCRLSRALQASRGKSGHGSVEGDWEEYWREFFSEAVQKAWLQHPNRSVVMTLAPIDISRIIRCDDFSRAISMALVRFLQTDLCAPCLSKFPPWKRQSTHMQFYHFWMTPMAFDWIV
jgi:hypothetical protein